jgi:hypothetical protein
VIDGDPCPQQQDGFARRGLAKLRQQPTQLLVATARRFHARQGRMAEDMVAQPAQAFQPAFLDRSGAAGMHENRHGCGRALFVPVFCLAGWH